MQSDAGVDLTAVALTPGKTKGIWSNTGFDLKLEGAAMAGYRTRRLTQGDWNAVQDALSRAHYESLPPWLAHPGGRDGERWVLEFAKNGRYWLVDRWSPDSDVKEPAFVAACQLLVALAGGDLGPGRSH